MPESFLLSRVLLRFNPQSEDLSEDLSAAVVTPDGSLWGSSDELISVERLSPTEPYFFGDRKTFSVGDFVDLLNENQIAIEGIDCSHNYL